MRNKLWLWLMGIIFGLAFFSSLKIVVQHYYRLQQVKGNYTLAMALMDKVNVFDLSSYILGGLHFSVVIVILMIVLDG